VLALKFRAGLFEHPFADPDRVGQVVGAPAHAQLARKVADEAMVLLKNQDRLLPLDPAKMKSLAVIGPNAAKVRLGGYSGSPAYFVTVLDGIRKRVGDKVAVSYAEGVRISEPDRDPASNKITPYVAPSAEKDAALIAEAVETARKADVVVLVLGGNETVTREAFGGMGGRKPSLGDSDDLELPGRQNELVREVMKLGKPTVAVLLNGRAQSIVELSRSTPAILEGWYLGQETGNAVAGVLFGDVNPSGKLPVTIARSAAQLPVYYYRKPQARLGYVFNDNSPLYPFGFGLSYTTFAYGKPALDQATIARDGSAKVSVAVTNSGDRAGDEIVQLYVHPRVSSVVQPILRLAGFERVHLEPGETRTVSFVVGPEQLAIWDRQMKQVVEPGTVDVSVGASSQQLASVALEVKP
jgi:beta-glucosidase